MPKEKRTIWVYSCTRCEHEWMPRNIEQHPRVCPHCKSPYWDTPRQRGTTKSR